MFLSLSVGISAGMLYSIELPDELFIFILLFYALTSLSLFVVPDFADQTFVLFMLLIGTVSGFGNRKILLLIRQVQ